MLIYVLSAYPGPPKDANNFAFLWFKESAEQDPFGCHELTDDVERADIILFIEAHPAHDPYLLGVLRHPIYRRFPKKTFLYHDADGAVAVLKGIYPSIRKCDYFEDRCRSAGYIARIAQNDAIRYDPERRPGKWLYSFLGEANSPVRQALVKSDHPEGNVCDTSGSRLWQMGPSAERNLFTARYAESIVDSQFVLCPRGFGPSSYRLFETMEMGRVPVIISDQWVPPAGPKWDLFSVTVPEALVGNVQAILQNVSGRHESMGQLARLAWEEWFAKPVCFHRLVELCLDIQRTTPRPMSELRAWSTVLRPPHLRNILRPYYLSATEKLHSTFRS